MHGTSSMSSGSTTGTFPFSVGGRVLADPTEGLFFLSEPRPGGEKVKEAINRATKRVQKFWKPFHYWRARDIWYRKARRVEDYEIQAIIRAAEAKETRELRDEFAEIQSRIRILEIRLNSQDADFHSPSLGALGEMAGQFGRKNSTGR